MNTAQAPLPSHFSAASSWREVISGIDLTGKHAIVTGGHSGLGHETVQAIVSAGASVTVAVRNVAEARSHLQGMPKVHVWPLDLADPLSIDAFAQRYIETGQPLHILVNNAGIMALPALERDGRGYELQFATNHLGHFHLTNRLWPALVASGNARVVSVSSRAHRLSPVIFDDIHFAHRPYERWLSYAQSKTANVLFAVELDRRGKTHGIRAFSCHPGSIVDTGLARHLTEEEIHRMGAIDQHGRPVVNPALGFKTSTQGAATQVWCATHPQLQELGGLYCENVNIAPIMTDHGSASPAGSSGQPAAGVKTFAIDPSLAFKLWTCSEEMTGVTFPPHDVAP